jgi:type VI secretion system protein ImpA
VIRDSWLADVAPDAPCGPDLQYDQDFLALEAAARGKPEQQYGTTIIPAEEPDWPGLAKSASALLDRAHDLRVLVYYARAATHTEGLRGLADALDLVREWLAKYWEPLHPTLVIDGDPEPEIRMYALSALADGDGLVRDVRAADLLRNAGIQVTIRDAEKILDPKIGTSDAGVGLEQLRAALADAIAKDTALLPEPAAIVATVTAIRTELLQHLEPSELPDLAALAELMKPVAAMVEDIRTQVTGVVADGTPGASADGAPATVHGVGDIRSREDALRALDRVCDFLGRSEPTNPAPLLIRRAQRLMTMPFMDIIRELAPDATSRVESITGVTEGQ